MSASKLETVIRPRLPIDLRRSLAALRHGPYDPTVRLREGEVSRTTRTPLGPATVTYRQRGDEVEVTACGPGAEHAIASAADTLGERDNLDGWEPRHHRLVAEIDRRMPGLRMIATGAVFEALVPTILEQKVTSEEAHQQWGRMVRRWGEPAPGSNELRLPPSASKLASEPYYRFHPFGVERKRTDIIRRTASRAKRLESLDRQGLELLGGIGVWTSAKVAQVAWADADAVAVGDYNLPGLVVYALTGRMGGDDDAMLELLEPFRPHRARAARLLKFAGRRPPRRAPRARLRDLRPI